MQEHHPVAPLLHRDVGVRQTRQALGQLRQLVIVRREDGARTRATRLVEMLGHRPREREAVVGRRATPDLVEQHQRTGRRRAQDVRGLGHLDHERALPRAQSVGRTDAREQPIHETELRRRRRHPRTGLGQQCEQRHLTQIGALTAHVGAGEQEDLPGASVEMQIVRDELTTRQQALDDRMPDARGDQPIRILDRGPGPRVAHRDLGQRGAGIEPSERIGDRLERGDMPDAFLAERDEEFVLTCLELVLGAQHLGLARLELRRDIALGVRQRLTTLVVRRHLVAMRVRDLEVETEHLVVADLEARDARALTFAGLEVRDPLLARVR